MIHAVDIAPPATAPDDLRLGHWLVEQKKRPRVAFVGFPSDAGVKLNGGRPGAADAPGAIRKMLYKLTPDSRNYAAFCALLKRTTDLGNVQVSGDVDLDQQHLGEVLAPLLQQETIPIVLGGGHETAFGHFLGYAKSAQPVHITNIDAHADVRPLKNGKAHSGSPFFQALEFGANVCHGYTVLGLSPLSVAQAHIQYLMEKGCVFHWRNEIDHAFLHTYFTDLKQPTMLTLDMDVVHQAEAPGVSAPAADGIPLKLVYEAAYLAGKSPFVKSLDLVEVNPLVDKDLQTVRAAAVTLWYFLCGLTERTA
ncbi:MAG: formimidoylglutamase [Bacteroidota bacterium]